MTNKIGTTFVIGEWYNCNRENYFFKYIGEHTGYPKGVRYDECVCNGKYEKNSSYFNAHEYIDGATLATAEEIQKFLPYQLEISNNYEIY